MLILLPLLTKSTNQSLQSVLSNTTSTILVETQFVSSFFKGPRKGGERSQQYLELQSYAKHKHNCGFI